MAQRKHRQSIGREIVAALEGASNRLIDVEASSEEELETLECHYGELAELAGKHVNLAESHSVEEAREALDQAAAAAPAARWSNGVTDAGY